MSWRRNDSDSNTSTAAVSGGGDSASSPSQLRPPSPRREAPPSRMGPQKSQEGWVIFVTGVHQEAEEDDLKDAFSEYGTVQKVVVNRDRLSGQCKGYALVEYGQYTEAQDAINSGHSVLGKQVGVDWAFVKPGRGGGGGRSGRSR